MKAVANNPKFAKKAGVPTSVGKEFAAADEKRGKYAAGGETMKMSHDSKAYKAKEKKHVQAMKKAGVPKKIVKEEAMEAGVKMAKGGFVRSADGIAKKGKTSTKRVKMAGGGRCG